MGHSNIQLAYDGLQIEIETEEAAGAEARSSLLADRLDGLAVFHSAEKWHEYYVTGGRAACWPSETLTVSTSAIRQF